MAFSVKTIIMRLAISAVVVLGTTACTGMYMGIPASDDATGPQLTEDEVRARADIYSITPDAVQRLQHEQQAEDDMSRALRDASALLPRGADYVYTVSPRDVLLVTVWNHPELNNPAGQLSNEVAGRKVGADGYFFYPYIGPVKAAGRTLSEIRTEMAGRLANYLTEPQVDVSIMQYRGRKAFVVGQVDRPGPVPITDEPLFVTTLLTEVGGLGDDADMANVVLNRKGELHNLDLYALYYQGDLSQNILLEDGDILNIPLRTQEKVFVLGEVVEPQSKIMPWGRYTLADALGDAGGLNPVTSRASQVYVMRAVDSSRPEIWHLNASSPTALMLADNFVLRARDVVFVDAAAVTRWSRVINQVLPTASSLISGGRAFK